MSLFPHHRGIPKFFRRSDGNYSENNQTHKITVPNGKAWQIIHMGLSGADSGVRQIRSYGENGDILGSLVYVSAGTGLACGPVAPTGYTQLIHPLLVLEKQVVRFDFGAAQTTGGDYLFLLIIEYDLEEIFKGG